MRTAAAINKLFTRLPEDHISNFADNFSFCDVSQAHKFELSAVSVRQRFVPWQVKRAASSSFCERSSLRR